MDLIFFILIIVVLILLSTIFIMLSKYYGWDNSFYNHFRRYENIDGCDYVLEYFTKDVLDEFLIFKELCLNKQEKEIVIHTYSNNDFRFSFYFCCYEKNKPFAVFSWSSQKDEKIHFIGETIKSLKNTSYALYEKDLRHLVGITEKRNNFIKKINILSTLIKDKKNNMNKIYYQ